MIDQAQREVIERGAKWTAQANKLSEAKSAVDEVMQDYPEDACGSAWLEEAIELIGRAEGEIDDATVRLVGEGL